MEIKTKYNFGQYLWVVIKVKGTWIPKAVKAFSLDVCGGFNTPTSVQWLVESVAEKRYVGRYEECELYDTEEKAFIEARSYNEHDLRERQQAFREAELEDKELRNLAVQIEKRRKELAEVLSEKA